MDCWMDMLSRDLGYQLPTSRNISEERRPMHSDTQRLESIDLQKWLHERTFPLSAPVILMVVFVVTAVVFYRKVVANTRLSETGLEAVEILSVMPHKTYFTVFLDICFDTMISLNMNCVKLKILEKTAALRTSYYT